MEASLLTRVKSLIRDLIHLVLGLLRRQRLACSTELATRRLRHRWKAESVLFPMVHHGPALDQLLIVGRLFEVRVTKCFMSLFVLRRLEPETLENVRSSKQRTSTHTKAVRPLLYLASSGLHLDQPMVPNRSHMSVACVSPLSIRTDTPDKPN